MSYTTAGNPSDCILVVNLTTLPSLLPPSNGPKRSDEQEYHNLVALQELYHYAVRSNACRAVQLVRYFGQDIADCGNCDVCINARGRQPQPQLQPQPQHQQHANQLQQPQHQQRSTAPLHGGSSLSQLPPSPPPPSPPPPPPPPPATRRLVPTHGDAVVSFLNAVQHFEAGKLVPSNDGKYWRDLLDVADRLVAERAQRRGVGHHQHAYDYKSFWRPLARMLRDHGYVEERAPHAELPRRTLALCHAGTLYHTRL